MIVDEGRTLVATYLTDTFTKAKIGIGGNNTNPLAEDLDVEIQSIAATRSTSDINVVDFKFTITGASVAGYTIRELGIFNADYSKMLTRINFEGIGPFASGEDVDFFVTIEVE